MKKLVITMAALFLSLTLVANLSFAQDSQQGKCAKKEMTGKMMKSGHDRACCGKKEKGANEHKMRMMHGKMQKTEGLHDMMMNDAAFKTLHNLGCPGFLLKNSGNLSLTDEQVKTLKSYQTDFQKFATKKQAEKKIVVIDLKQIAEAENPDFSKIKKQIDALSSIEGELREEFLKTSKKSMALLNNEQRKKLPSLRNPSKPGMEMMKHGKMK